MPVKKGDIIDIVLPATCCTEEEITNIKNYVTNLGLTPRILLEDQTTPTIEENLNNEFPSYDAQKRAEQLHQALEAQSSKIIWCACGGYGSGDLLPFLSSFKPVKQNKLFIGYSDISSISTFLQQNWGWKTICAPMLKDLTATKIEKEAEEELLDLLFGRKKEFAYDLIAKNTTINNTANSEITGGCISVLAGHFGTTHQINFNGKILFLEDEGEDGERLNRYFSQIVDIIKEEKGTPSAILLGNFLQGNPHGTPKAENIRIAINNFVKKVSNFDSDIPVFESKGQDLGHSGKMRPLILGVKAKIVDDVLTISV